MVGILLSYWGGLFSGATLVSGRVVFSSVFLWILFRIGRCFSCIFQAQLVHVRTLRIEFILAFCAENGEHIRILKTTKKNTFQKSPFFITVLGFLKIHLWILMQKVQRFRVMSPLLWFLRKSGSTVGVSPSVDHNPVSLDTRDHPGLAPRICSLQPPKMMEEKIKT